ncbi:hypothetical protein [Bifidobacterium samirii]|uniref:Uncharacterized protein n=1 Tax=Bifidobacterium samirii TaxID=2306974 RepID=A0A430FUH7_9BIFI|nr:hypothetical protein [Bifidobacterium samirii]RSX56732.1 hypothetical protein D2E24_1022 [Bifidobacterium samirii]
MTDAMQSGQSEDVTALSMYAAAASAHRESILADAVEPPTGGMSIDGSADEATSSAAEYNAQRRESAHLRKLDAKNQRREQENQLRVTIAQRIIDFVAGQLVLTNMLAWLYALVMLARHDPIPSEVIIAWLSSTIVEIIGLLWVMARSLFPFRDRHRDNDAEKHDR